jgi:hypothetical protein
MVMKQPYRFGGTIRLGDGSQKPASIVVAAPRETSDPLFMVEIRSGLLPKEPYRVFSESADDAWAEAFDVLRQALEEADGILCDERGEPTELPTLSRDRSHAPTPGPDVTGAKPIYRTIGWVRMPGSAPRELQLAIWPAFEEEAGVFCAPMRCGLMRNGDVMCSYGATPEQAVYLAYKYLQTEVEFRSITDADGKLLEIPIPPEPPLPSD